jgi:predicted Zn-dependent protease
LLLDLYKPVEAARVLEFALRTCPDDADLLKLLAKSYKTSHQDQLASDAYHALLRYSLLIWIIGEHMMSLEDIGRGMHV